MQKIENEFLNKWLFHSDFFDIFNMELANPSHNQLLNNYLNDLSTLINVFYENRQHMAQFGSDYGDMITQHFDFNLLFQYYKIIKNKPIISLIYDLKRKELYFKKYDIDITVFSLINELCINIVKTINLEKYNDKFDELLKDYFD